uniref:Uncharacterized protein n=1 Tax=Manihot esculenta TaxID=3983 RepID=A0A2C9WL47_MANES
MIKLCIWVCSHCLWLLYNLISLLIRMEGREKMV